MFSDGYSTISPIAVMFAYHELCMDPMLLALIAIIVPLFGAVGGYAWLSGKDGSGGAARAFGAEPDAAGVDSAVGLRGILHQVYGLQTRGELYVLAVWFGMCLGSAQAFGRALFSELIPAGHESDMFALFEITDKRLVVDGAAHRRASVVQTTGKIRPVLIYLLCAMVLPGGLLHALDLEPSIRAAKGDTALAIDGTEDAEDVP